MRWTQPSVITFSRRSISTQSPGTAASPPAALGVAARRSSATQHDQARVGAGHHAAGQRVGLHAGEADPVAQARLPPGAGVERGRFQGGAAAVHEGVARAARRGGAGDEGAVPDAGALRLHRAAGLDGRSLPGCRVPRSRPAVVSLPSGFTTQPASASKPSVTSALGAHQEALLAAVAVGGALGDRLHRQLGPAGHAPGVHLEAAPFATPRAPARPPSARPAWACRRRRSPATAFTSLAAQAAGVADRHVHGDRAGGGVLAGGVEASAR